MARILAVLCGACSMLLCTMPVPAMPAGLQDDWRLDIAGLVDLRLATIDDETGWLEGGFGKVRYGAGRPEPVARVSEASLLLMPQYGWDLSGYFYLKADADQNQLIDLIEGYVTYKPVSVTGNRYRLRTGIFYPPVSLENTALAWTSPYLITPSAINAWVGEETRGYGTEASWLHATDDGEFSLTGAALWGTDKAGTELYRRGWAIHDFKPSIGDNLPVPVPASAPYLSSTSRSMIEIDERPGYYAAVEWKDIDGPQARLMYYDNRTDPTSVKGSEAGWLTKFTAAGMKWPLGDRTDLIAQYLAGYTLLGIPGRFIVKADLDSAFLLLTHSFGHYRLTGRLDWFDVDDVDGVSLDFSEHGWAATLAGRRELNGGRSVWIELLQIDSERPTRASASMSDKWHEFVVQASYRVEFR